MSIRPLFLRLRRFGSFSKEQTFPFPEEPGLYFMQGKNEAEPRMTANGTGKSTVWKGLTWLLYGKTPEGLKAGDVCSWDTEKGTAVEFDFAFDGEDQCVWTMKRTWGPNSWTLSHAAEFITDEEVVDLAKDPANPVLAELRLGFEPFLCSVLMAQGEDMFLDMKRDRQATLFATVMDLDGWRERSERASKAASDQDKRSRDLERRVADAQGRLAALEAADPAGDARKWEEKRKERMDALERQHVDLLDRRKTLAEALERAQKRETEVREGLAAVQPDKALEDERDDAAKKLRQIEDEITRLAARLDEAEEARRDADRGTSCPTCGKPLDTHDWQRHATELERKTRGLDAELKQWREKAKPVRNRVHVLDQKLVVSDRARAAARDAVDDADRTTARARTDLALCDRQLDGVEELYDAAERERNPLQDAVERGKQQRAELRDVVYDLGRELDDSHRMHSVKQLWVRGFKEIRLREIAAALSELEVEANSCVSALGLVGWELEFRVDRETKGGDVQRGFSVFVRSPGSKERAVPWESWSGGEKQRLRLAANMGLGNLVRARTGCGLPLEVWDEPTEGLSPEGKEDLFAALAARAKDEGRVVFLVDHQAYNFGGFAGTCTVIKTPSGSRVRTSWSKHV